MCVVEDLLGDHRTKTLSQKLCVMSVLGKIGSVRIWGGLGQRTLGQVTAAMMIVLSVLTLLSNYLEHLEGLRIAVSPNEGPEV